MTQISVVDDKELNQWIHEKMLGYTRDFLQQNNSQQNIQVWIGETPDYCSSFENALQIIERLRESGILVSIVNSLEGLWTVSILEWDAEQNCWQTPVTVTNESLPRAVCQGVVALTHDEE